MEPVYALVVIATVAFVRPFIEGPDAKAKGAAQKRGGYVPNPKVGCLYMLLFALLLPLWWYYALATDQVLLGVIPTAGTVAAFIAVTIEQAAAKKDGA